MWKPISLHEYLNIYSANHKVISCKLNESGKYGREMEVITGIGGKQTLKHTINPAFEIKCWVWED